MKAMVAILIAIGVPSTMWAGEGSGTNTHSELVRFGFVYVEPSPAQQKTLDANLSAVKLLRKGNKACKTIEDARTLLWQSINIAGVSSKRVCTDYKGYFWFSRLDWAREDDRTFRSGLAVKKGTGEIYHWEEEKAKPDAAANRSGPIGPPNRTSSAAGYGA